MPSCLPACHPATLLYPLSIPCSKNKTYSRRRAHRDDKDVDYINDRNAHFNAKIQRAFGAATAEIKANLERGTVSEQKGFPARGG